MDNKIWNNIWVCALFPFYCANVCLCTAPYPAGGSKTVPVSQELNRRRVLMASRRGTSVFIKPGDILRIGTRKHTCVPNLYLSQIDAEKQVHVFVASSVPSPYLFTFTECRSRQAKSHSTVSVCMCCGVNTYCTVSHNSGQIKPKLSTWRDATRLIPLKGREEMWFLDLGELPL